ncbi:polynucleotide adenylyltransferase PcnB [Candidatus Pseudothioglobus singularis]|uniref:Poly(A) polymerase I n=1 Tax=Candidatus Pseudothioglobus singularis PS1 TaxID=1125411 RepID=A0A0M4LZV8_9GAMM|nr:polynucleotide adenylyltransferase PcnB [Candidatus Pseudothioglobus singularis]ALE01787.1 poly(A) polymerase [Candidatus Pseudothioglobus singularis PS1]
MSPIRQKVKFDKKLLDQDALKILKKLNKSDHETYLVGGCIRDILLGHKPKDFDIATSATPEQIHKLFKRSRIIGRRFKLVHIMFSARKFIEVATFRAGKVQTSNDGLVLRDNYYGALEDDVFRRDFTVNGLYYDIKKSEIIDYVGGLDDLKALKIKMIGDPSERFEEDPVRMIRAVRFQAKLNANIESQLIEAIQANSQLLVKIPPARLYEEVIKLFHNENSIEIFHELDRLGLLRHLFSQTKENPFVDSSLINTSERIRNGNSVTPAFLFAVFLWSAVNKRFNQISKKNKSRIELMLQASEDVIKKQTQQVMMPRWLSSRVKDIWLMQYQLENYNPKKSKALIRNPRFRMAYDFLVLRSESIDKDLRAKAEYWTNIQK